MGVEREEEEMLSSVRDLGFKRKSEVGARG
jgi:hypothetical protein